jgi:hypothetical protein
MPQNEADQHSVTICTDLAEGLPKVMADRVQLQQVLLNAILNGTEAIPDTSGEVSIKSQLAEDQLLISITDTGVGPPTKNADQIFDSFFTTKSQGYWLGTCYHPLSPLPRNGTNNEWQEVTYTTRTYCVDDWNCSTSSPLTRKPIRFRFTGKDNRWQSSDYRVARLRCDAMASERRHYDTKTSIPHARLTSMGDMVDRPAGFREAFR